MSGEWCGGKGDRRRKATPTDKQIKNKVGCTWCEHYLMIKKKCLKPDNVKCPMEE